MKKEEAKPGSYVVWNRSYQGEAAVTARVVRVADKKALVSTARYGQTSYHWANLDRLTPEVKAALEEKDK